MKRLGSLFRLVQMRDLRARPFVCPACGPSLLVRLGLDEMLVRCVRCRGTPVHLSLIAAIKASGLRLADAHAYELSTQGVVHAYLRHHCRELTGSEFLHDVPTGAFFDGVRCEDVQALSFPDGAFDLCTSTEVFEHVPDDLAGYRELHRVLRRGGWMFLTVPLTGSSSTVQRAVLTPQGVHHLLPPAYHGDRLTGADSVLVYRDYGTDIVERVRACGFESAELWVPPSSLLGYHRQVVIARR